jgi:hypothetical protein
MWQVSAGSATLRPAPGGWLDVVSRSPGSVTVRARLNVALLNPADPLRSG